MRWLFKYTDWWLGLIILALGARLLAVLVAFFLPPISSAAYCREDGTETVKPMPFAAAFGLRESPPAPLPVEKPRETVSLQGYQLMATMIASPSMVIVKHGRKHRLLAIGDALDNGYVLREVRKERARFEKDGMHAWLSLPKSKMGSSVSIVPDDATIKEALEAIRKEENTYYVPKKLVSKMADLKKIFRYISIMPAQKNGQLFGFTVTRVKQRSVFDKMGLYRGDIIVKVNGKPLKSEADAFAYFNRIHQLDALTITVKRGPMLEDLRYELY